MKRYIVKLIVTEEHYIDIEADSEEEAMEKGESWGVNSLDAHSTEVEAERVVEVV